MGLEKQNQRTALASALVVVGEQRESAERKTDQQSVANLQMNLMGRKQLGVLTLSFPVTR